jgi:phosphohistidine swiveling domain-containing protein
MTIPPFVLPLFSSDATIALVGGKGYGLTRLATAGLPVPDGFVITTRAYDEFVQAHGLMQRILGAMEACGRDSAGLEAAAERIRVLFEDAEMSTELEQTICEQYAICTQRAVAVRSSATTEDLPEASFAGQQDSFLNVRGEAALLAAVKRCWASLWNARAIGYRDQLNVDPATVSMAVVVQGMVDAEASGILFTANPMSGDRTELVINAGFGLGEAVVGGEITPDSFVLGRRDLSVREEVVAAKSKMRVAVGEQGTGLAAVPEAKRQGAALDAETLARLGTLALKAEAVLDGGPQDVEWAVAQGECWLLQSRPITHLPDPLPKVSWEAPYEGARLVRRQVVENMPEPLSPLFEEVYLNDGLDLGLRAFISRMEMPFDMEDLIELPLFLTVNGYGYCRYEFKVSWKLLAVIPRLLVWYVTVLPRWLKNIVGIWQEGLDAYRAAIDRYRKKPPVEFTSAELIAGIRELAAADAIYWLHITIAVGAAKVTDGMLDRFVSSRGVRSALSGKALISAMFLRGFPSKTLESQVDLARVAELIRANPVAEHLLADAPRTVLDALAADERARPVADELRAHLETYGHQVYNLDFIEPTQGEDPTPVIVGLRGLVRDYVLAEGVLERQAAMVRERETLEATTIESLGPIRRWVFKKLLAWAQSYAPYREEALFYMGAAWPTLRGLALELGRRLTEAGVVVAPEDVFYLVSSELSEARRALSGKGDPVELAPLVKSRRALRELRKRAHPPRRVPEDVRFKVGIFDVTRFLEMWETQKLNAEDSDILSGFAVSPGRVTGTASVILSSADFADMAPDTILVCPTTTPAWTPLFSQARGLVTDIGAVLAHGSIVAREYGIPAVLGTGNATRRIVSGQRITVDGSAGTVTLLEHVGSSAE